MKTAQLLNIVTILVITSFSAIGSNYNNFKVSIYTRSYEVKQMASQKWLDSTWQIISTQLKVDKIYLETHRDLVMVDEKTLEKAKKFFLGKGLEVAGGITYTINESNRFETFCYSNPEHRKKAKEIAEFTAKHFDEFILDDFFFTNCKCELCIKAKGNQSWTQFRLNLMKNAAEELVINPAKTINPKVKVVIKYPNWYEHFQGLGFNLEAGPKQFDGIYTGTETRDPDIPGQHLQQYESYLIFRYFENIKPGGNGGGWVDPFASFYMDRYAEQLWNTAFAKAPEITLFDYRQLIRPIKSTDRAQWQGSGTSFDFDEMTKPYKLKDGTSITLTSIARAAGYSFEQVDLFIGKLGQPVGIKTYKPFHSTGEDFLQNYLGMIGLPMDIVPKFPTKPDMILLTEQAKFDLQIIEKIKGQLLAGKNVTITSGLLKALQGKGIEDIVELEFTNKKAFVRDFGVGWRDRPQSKENILIPQIKYLTNDSWEDITSLGNSSGWPILHQAAYGKAFLFVLTIPDDFGDLYQYPPEVLNRIRTILSQDIPVRIEGPSKISLYVYDNETFITESYLPEKSDITVIVRNKDKKLIDLLTGEELTGKNTEGARIWGRKQEGETAFILTLNPHSYKVFKIKGK